MAQIGLYSLTLSWFLAGFAILAGALSGKRRDERWFQVARSATIFVALTSLLSFLALGWSFANDDYTLQYVWQYSNRAMPAIYKFTAIWGGMDGSMLLWALFLAAMGAALSITINEVPRRLAAWTLSAVNSSSLFFLTVTLFITNPFRYINSPFIPPDGNGLNPLLQNAYMAIHPPMLYLGFTGLAIPYAFAIGALLSKDLSQDWVRFTRRWTLIAWGFLTIGIFLGGHWAYLELGWGGFWAWDPVENASFLPWLTATAFLHSIMVQERRDMLRSWNIWLIVVTYALTVFGTFLTRSGVVQSVHAFASTNVGWIFLVYLGLILGQAAYLSWRNRGNLASTNVINNIFSREAVFLVNNLILLSLCFTIMWGVMFPVISEWVTGSKQTVGIPYFNAVTIPLFLALIFLMAIAPFIPWKDGNWQMLKRACLWPFVTSLMIAGILVLAGVNRFYPTLAYALSAFVIITLSVELHMAATRAKTAIGGDYLSAVKRAVVRQRARYGGHLVHFGVAIVTIAITASMAHKTEQEFSLAVGESYQTGKFSLTLESLDTAETSNYDALRAPVALKSAKTGEVITTLLPEIRRYKRNDETTSEVALKIGPLEDVYLVLAGTDDTGTRAALKIFINPLQFWLWIGGLVMVAGTIVVLLPKKLPAPATSTEATSTANI